MVIRTLLLLLALATTAWAGPIHFTVDDRPIFVFCGDPTRFAGPVMHGCGLRPNELGMVAYVGQWAPGDAPVPFHAEAMFAGAMLGTMDLMLPPPRLGDAFTTLGVIFALTLPDGYDGTVQPLRVLFALPGDQAVFDLTYETPVPEPTTLALYGLSLVALGWRLKRP